MFTIASWNVNSIAQRLSHVTAWLKENQPDVLLLQELKCVEDKFPFAELEALDFNAAVFGQKAWNGVAILARHRIEDVMKGLPGDPGDDQARYIEATVKGVRVASIYLPNGNPVESEKYPYKMKWLDRLIIHAGDLLAQETPVVLGGDYNVVPEPRDCYDPEGWKEDALFRLDSRKKLRALLHLGFTDAFRAVNDESQQYTFWDYQAGSWHRNFGLRIDHLLLSPQAADRLKDCRIDKKPRAQEKASDHTPIIAYFSY